MLHPHAPRVVTALTTTPHTYVWLGVYAVRTHLNDILSTALLVVYLFGVFTYCNTPASPTALCRSFCTTDTDCERLYGRDMVQ